MLGGEWQGFGAAQAALEACLNDFTRDEVIVAGLVKAGKPVVLDIRAQCVRRPPAPDMADAMTIGPAPDEAEPGGVAIAIGPRRSNKHWFLWGFFERGTSKMSARPLIRQVFESHGAEAGITQRFVAAITPEFVKALARAKSAGAAMAAGGRRASSPFQRMRRATSRSEFMAALRDWAPGEGE